MQKSQNLDELLVLMVTPGGLEHGGGIGRVAGYMLEAWATKIERPRFEVVDSRGTGHVIFSPLYLLRSLAQIAANADRRPLVHVHVAGRGSTLRKIAIVHFSRILGLPVVLHLHDYSYEESLQRFPRLVRRAISSMFQRAQHVIVLSRADRQLAIATLGVRPAQVTIVPNAVPHPGLDNEKKAQAGPCHILFLGNLSRRKGVHDLIAALGSSQLRKLNWRATIAGGGSELSTFIAQAHAAGLDDKITFPGWVNRTGTETLLQSADILTLPSYAEGMAMAVLEGLAYGLTVVCTPVGGLSEVIENGVSGIFVLPGDVAGLATSLATCVTDSGLRRRLGTGGMKAFRSGFDSAQYPEKLRDIYKSAILGCG